MGDIQNVIDALQDANVNEIGHVWITDSARNAMVRILMKEAERLKEQEKEIDEISDEYLDLGNEMAKQPKPKTGKWVGEEYWYMCSECQFDCPHFIRDWNYEQVRTQYCPHCGAKMENASG